MLRAALAGLVLVLAVLSAPLAFAQPPPTAECVAAETALATAVAVRDAAVAAQAPLAVEGDLGVTELEVARLEASIVADPTREAELRPRIDAIEAVIAAESAVTDATAARDAACAVVVTPPVVTPTVEPTPEPTLTPSPTLPPGDDGDFSDVGRAPVGGVATGG